MEIYTIQHPGVLAAIEKEGYYRPEPSTCLDNTDRYYGYRLCYRWMIDELEKKCGLPYEVEEDLYRALKEEDDRLFSSGWKMEVLDDEYPCLAMPPSSMPHPVWGWQKVYGRPDGKPDMRSWTTGEPEQVVRLKLEIPEERLLFSDFEHWHIPLNMGYFPAAETFEEWQEADDAFDAKCRTAGFENGDRDLFSRSIDHIYAIEENSTIAALQREFLDSWKNVLVDVSDLGSKENPAPFMEVEWERRETQCVFWEIMESDVKKVEHFTTRRAGRC